MTRATSGSVTATWGTGQNRTAGHLLVAMVSAGGSTASAAALSTPAGWTQQVVTSNVATTANAWVAVYTKVAAGGDSAPAFTATLTGTVAMTVTLLELAAANDLSPVDTSGTYGSGGSSGTLSSMTVTTAANVSVAGEYAVTVYCQEAAAATNTWNGGGGWTNAANDGATSSVLHTAVDYQANPSAAATLSETGHWTTDTSAFGTAIIVAFGMQSGSGLELFTNDAATTIIRRRSTTPAAGTAELWTAASWSAFPVASPTTTPPTTFHIADPGASSELIQVVNTSTGLVVRGSQGTAPVAHFLGVHGAERDPGRNRQPRVYNVRDPRSTRPGMGPLTILRRSGRLSPPVSMLVAGSSTCRKAPIRSAVPSRLRSRPGTTTATASEPPSTSGVRAAGPRRSAITAPVTACASTAPNTRTAVVSRT